MNATHLESALRILLEHRRSRAHCVETRAAIRATIRRLRTLRSLS